MIVFAALVLLGLQEETIAIAPRPIHERRWITERDYSRKRTRGSVEVTLNVTATGRVDRCTVTKSSQSKLLDHETCRLLLKRARFKPAFGPTGNFAMEYTMAFHWPPRARN